MRSGNSLITISYNGGGCASTSLTTGPASGANFNVGTTAVVYTVNDGVGNTATCSAIVTVASQAITSVLSAPTTTCGFNLTCAGANNGTASVTATGGCPGISYLCSNGSTTSTIIGLNAGTYLIEVATELNEKRVLRLVVQ